MSANASWDVTPDTPKQENAAWSLPGARQLLTGSRKSPFALNPSPGNGDMQMAMAVARSSSRGSIARSSSRSGLASSIRGSIGKLSISSCNAQWNLASASTKGDDRVENANGYAMLAEKYANQKNSTSSLSSMSTSALSQMVQQQHLSSQSRLQGIGEEDARGKGIQHGPPKLRKETLMSLGIDMRMKPRSCMKKGKGLQRAATMTSLNEMKVFLPTGQTLRRNLSITFKDKVRVKKIPSSSSLAENPAELWYQNHEMDSMKKKTKELIALADDPIKRSQHNYRGLERHMPENRESVRSRRFDTWDHVLETQQFQRDLGEFDEEKMARMIRNLSNQSLQEAQQRAAEDASFALAGY